MGAKPLVDIYTPANTTSEAMPRTYPKRRFSIIYLRLHTRLRYTLLLSINELRAFQAQTLHGGPNLDSSDLNLY